MAEYIEREAVYKDFEKCNSENPNWTPQRVKTLLLRQPAADVAPVRHGRWIGAPLCGNDNCKCSECGSWHNIHANLRGKIRQKYCPNCGAKMDGGGGNSDIM